jgi:hypothetical protein
MAATTLEIAGMNLLKQNKLLKYGYTYSHREVIISSGIRIMTWTAGEPSSNVLQPTTIILATPILYTQRVLNDI